MLGYPGETEADIQETSNFIKECNFDFVYFNNFQPLPGSPVYDDLLARNEITEFVIPTNYSDGVRAYTAPELKDFNFSKFVLSQYLRIAIHHPLSIIGLFRQYSVMFMIKKLFMNFRAMVFPKGPIGVTTD